VSKWVESLSPIQSTETADGWTIAVYEWRKGDSRNYVGKVFRPQNRTIHSDGDSGPRSTPEAAINEATALVGTLRRLRVRGRAQ